MLVSGWQRAIKKAGRTQRSLAEALHTNVAEVNRVVNGFGFFSPERFHRACELLGVTPEQVYGPDALCLLYGIGEGKSIKPDRKRGAQVRLDPDVQERVDFVANDEHLNRTQAANAIIRRAFECLAEGYGIERDPDWYCADGEREVQE